MPAAIPAIAAAAAGYGATALAVSAGVVVAGSIGATVIGAVASLAVSSLLGSVFNNAPEPQSPDFSQGLTQPGGGRTQQVRQPISPHLVPIGRVKLSGPITFIHSKDDDDGRANGYIYLIHTLAGVKVKRIGDVYLGDTLTTDSSFAGLVRVGKHLGADDQAADADLVSEIGGANWTANHRGRGRAYLATRLKWSQEAFASGLPNVSAIVDGVDEIYDPRDATTAFHNNAALCIAWWLTSAQGMNLAWSRLDEASVIAAANVCDERVRVFGSTTTFAVDGGSPTTNALVLDDEARLLDWGDGVRVSASGALPSGLAAATTYYVIPSTNGTIKLASSVANAFDDIPVSVGAGGSGTLTLQYWDEARYKCNGTFSLDMPKRDVLEQLLSSMAGIVVHLGGKWFVHAGAAATPTADALTEIELRGDYVYTPKRSMRDRFNGVRAVIVNPDKNWQPSDLPPLQPTAALLLEDDDEELYTDIRLPFTTSARCAQRLMKIHRERNRRQGVIEYPGNLAASDFAPWDGAYFTIGRGDGTYALDEAQFRITGFAMSEDLGIDLVGTEDDADVYAWDASEELTVSVSQDVVLPDPSTIAAPVSITITAPTTPTFSQLEATWPAVLSIWRDGYDFEYRDDGDTDWNSIGRIGDDAQDNNVNKVIILTNMATDLQVRAVTKNGSPSAFVQNLAPDAPTSPSATGGAAEISVDVDAPAAATVQIFSGTEDSFASSSLLTAIAPGAFPYTHSGLGSAETRYYWFRAVNAGGNISAETSSVNATTT